MVRSVRRPRRVRGLVLGPVLLVVAALAAGPGTAGGATPGGGFHATAGVRLAHAAAPRDPAGARVAAPAARHLEVADSQGACTANGQGTILFGVTPGETVDLSCVGFPADDDLVVLEGSPLYLATGSQDDLDPNGWEGTTGPDGSIDGPITLPNPFAAPDPAAVCPPTGQEVAEGFYRCFLGIQDAAGNTVFIALDYAGQPEPPPPPTWTGIAATPSGNGYWLCKSDGTVSAHGSATNYGGMNGHALNAPISHIVPTPDGKGYWLVAADGGTFAFGDAGFFGSTGSMRLNAPVVDLAPTPDGKGYWLVATDGGIFAYGDATYWGSMGGHPLNQPVVGLAADNATKGYWLVATDGGIFAFHAPFYGSTGNLHLNQPVNGMTPTPNDKGYWFVASDGGIFAEGNAAFHGSMGGKPLNAPIVGMATDNATGGYWLAGADGGIFAFDAPYYGAA
jgi:hypothetical protein